jgi:hypothetical protein
VGNKEDTPSLRLSSGLYAYDSARPVALLLPLTRPMESPFDGTAARGAGPTDTHERASSRERQRSRRGGHARRRRARDSGRCALAESTTTRVRFEPLPRSCFVAVSSVADCAEVAHVYVRGCLAIRGFGYSSAIRTPRGSQACQGGERQDASLQAEARRGLARAPRAADNIILIGARRARVGVIFCEGNRGQKMWYQ